MPPYPQLLRMMSRPPRTKIRFEPDFVGRTLRIGACGAALLLSTSPGTSAPAKTKASAACKSAYKSAQQLESASRLGQAREALLGCVKATCGALRQKCAERYAQLESDIPSVIPIVTDEAGRPRQDVRVTIDGVMLTSQLDGRALPIDPGLHAFAFSTEAGVVATVQAMILEGEHNRPISVSIRSSDNRGAKRNTLAGASPAAPTDESTDEGAQKTQPAPERKKASRVPATAAPTYNEPPPIVESSGGSVAPYLLGGVGLVGLGAYGMFTYWGKKDNEQLSACSPSCQPASLEHIRKLYLVADISLGVGVVALGAATVVALSSGSSKKKESAYAVDVQPGPSGALATVSGSF